MCIGIAIVPEKREGVNIFRIKYCNLIGHARGPYFRSAIERGFYCILRDGSVDSIVSSRLGRWTLLYPQDSTVDSIVSQGYGALLHLAMARYMFYAWKPAKGS